MKRGNSQVLGSSAIVLVVGSLLIAGCASTPITNEKLAVAKASVQRAEQAGGPVTARQLNRRVEVVIGGEHNSEITPRS
jgi:hypothetical protein